MESPQGSPFEPQNQPSSFGQMTGIGNEMIQSQYASQAFQGASSNNQENTSGQGHNAIVPEEIKGWNWGAFLLSWIWGIGNQTYVAFLTVIPLVNLVMIFVLGAKGSEWAWKNKRWESVEDFRRVQRQWAKWGIGIIGFFTIFFTIIFMFVFSGTSGAVKAADEFFNDVSQGDIDAAYSLMVPNQFTKEQLALNVKRNPKYGQVVKSSFSSRSITGSHATIKGKVTLKDGSELPVSIEEDQLNGSWKIKSIDGLSEPDQKVQKEQVSDVADVTPNVPIVNDPIINKNPFEYLGETFTLGWQGGKDGQTMYELYPAGENSDNWTKLITVVRDTSLSPSQITAEVNKAAFDKTMGYFVGQGAVVAVNSVIKDPKDFKKDIYFSILSFSSKTDAEVDIKKSFISYAGEHIGVTYGVRISGANEADLKKKVDAQISQMQELQDQFISTKFPFPWER